MIDHISRQANGTVVGIWGRFLLRSAFQPLFAFVDGKLKISAYEGLIRPFQSGRPVSPEAFFASISAIDRFRIETLTRTLHVFNARSRIGAEASLFLNFDPSVFTDPMIADRALKDLRLVLHEAGIDPARVVCELTEKKSGSDEAMFGFVEALRTAGFRIAVDDYGADDSDIGRIKDIKPDIVKFDAAWITKLMETDPGAALLAAMVEKFQSMGICTVFEGLEERWQLDLADTCRVDMVQGFILARPELVSADEPIAAAVMTLGGETEAELADDMPSRPPRSTSRLAARPFGRRTPTP
jgi:EAL domain-containing protein (putative c-di-GMP-specific phosphodiesterase class I)